MKTRRKKAAALFALAGLVVAAAVWRYQRSEIMYENLTLTEWLEIGDAESPLRALGTDLLPAYAEVLKQRQSTATRLLAKVRTRLPGRLGELLPRRADEEVDARKKSAVLRALRVLGCDAASAMPHAFELLIDPERNRADFLVSLAARDLYSALRCRQIMEQLIAELGSNDMARRSHATLLLIPYGRAASNAVPALQIELDRGQGIAGLALAGIGPETPGLPEKLVRIAGSTNSPIGSRFDSLAAIATLGPRAAGIARQVRLLLTTDLIPQVPLPSELVPEFGHERWLNLVIAALGNIGSAAKAAQPELANLLTHTNCATRLFAARALWQMDADAGLVLPVLKQTILSGGGHPGFQKDWGNDAVISAGRFAWNESTSYLDRIDQLTCRDSALFLVGQIESRAESVLPALREVTVPEDTLSQLLVARAIARITQSDTSYLELLIDKLDDTAGLKPMCVPAAYFLGELGARATLASPQLQVLQSHMNPTVRTAADYALLRITNGVIR